MEIVWKVCSRPGHSISLFAKNENQLGFRGPRVYTSSVTKQDLIAMIAALPDDPATDYSGVVSEIERLAIHQKISEGLAEIERGEGHSQKDVEDSIEAWVAEFS